MSAFHNTALMGASGQGGYFINNSLRFRSGASPYFTRTASVAGNRQRFTLSMWVKIGKTGVSAYRAGLFGSGNNATGGGSGLGVHIQGSNESSAIQAFVGGGTTMLLVTNQKFRDASAWYHLVFSIDTTQATAANRFRMYVNNQEITSFSSTTQISQNYSFDWNNSSSAIYLGAYNDGTPISTYFDGYMAEVYHVDGQQLTPSSFGQNDIVTGQWVPKAYTGTYGTNGFYLKFADTSGVTAATIGKDSSGNGNNLTPSGISNTAGITYDFMTDSPTVGPLASNYAVLNPSIRQWNTSDFVSDGNLKYTVGNGSGVTGTVAATIPMVSGKWYAEFYINAAVTAQWIGVSSNLARIGLGSVDCGIRNPGYAYKVNTGNKCNNDNTGTAYGVSSTTGDIIGVAMDADTGSITFYKNGTSLGVAYTGMTNTGNGWVFGCDSDPSGSFFVNFGQRPFSYTPPTGYSALNTYNLSAPAIPNGSLNMTAALWTANVASPTAGQKSIALGFQPGLVWSKNRSDVEAHYWVDSVRGDNSGSKWLRSNSTAVEGADAVNSVTAKYVFSSTGFDIIDTDSTTGEVYYTNRTYVGWAWKAGGTAVTNTSGTISSQVSANPTAGFSIVTYTGTGAAATVGHGLGVAPSLIIVKGRSTAGDPWAVYHASLANTQYLYLNTTAAVATGVNLWNSTTPTSSVFTIGSAQDTNRSAGTLVAYCFAAVAGYSAFGSYTGNGSADGPFVYTGFRPRFILIKSTTALRDWLLYDTVASNPYNTGSDGPLVPNSTDVTSYDGTAYTYFDILSNGFKLRNSTTNINASSEVHSYAAFAENPFKYSNAR
jgi:hypothetical protein